MSVPVRRLLLIPVLTLAACQEARIDAAFDRDLFEPGTARYHIIKPKVVEGPIICGLVSAKSHGGIYLDDKAFLIDNKTGETSYQTDRMLDEYRYETAPLQREPEFVANWVKACEQGMTYEQVRSTFDWAKGDGPYK